MQESELLKSCHYKQTPETSWHGEQAQHQRWHHRPRGSRQDHADSCHNQGQGQVK